jgi:nanoRNase/pAp phosphatase (c-di-AMP/oligoRNAs hydrolase)
MDWKKLADILKGHKVWIQTHNFPDADAIASAFGLQSFLELHGVKAEICYNGQVDKISVVKMIDVFQIDVRHIEQATIREEDYVVLVDGQKYNANLTDIPGDEVAVIDHHKTMIPCEYAYRDVRITGACASLIAEYFWKSKTNISDRVASALTYGIKMDTDSLNRGVTKLDLKMLAYLFDLTDHALVQSMYNNGMELEDLRAYGAAIENIEIYGELGVARIPFDCPDGLVAMVSDFILKLDAVTVSVIYSQRSTGLKFSVRSEKPHVHAGDLTAEALLGIGNGGGHFSMAGGFVPKENCIEDKSIEDRMISERFANAINKVIKRIGDTDGKDG